MNDRITRWWPLLTILLATSAAAQQSHWYVLLEPGNERWYRGANGHDFHELVTGYEDGYSVVEQSHYVDDVLFDVTTQHWLMEPDGDVWLGENCYLDMPLEIGKSWGRIWGEYDQYSDWFTVVGREDTWAPDCVVIREVIQDEGGSEIIIVRWYSDGIGLVHWEVSCAYCSFHLEPVVVGAEAQTWGDVKAAYRGDGR